MDLYESYYLSDNTPEDLVSSHWKVHLKKTDADISGERIRLLSKSDFGSYKKYSPANRVFSAISCKCYLHTLNKTNGLHKIFRSASSLVKKADSVLTNSCLRQLCALDLICAKMKKTRDRIKIINIGDGDGFLSALIKELFPDALICLGDLGKALLFQAHYCTRLYPGLKHVLVSDFRQGADYDDADFIYCPEVKSSNFFPIRGL